MARDGPPKIMKMGWLLEEFCVGQAIEPAAAFEAAGVCVSATRQDGLAGVVFDRADAFPGGRSLGKSRATIACPTSVFK